jgi:DNA repair photolyase
MKLIYQPKGKAREYSPYALNIYSGGCDHACRYCYCHDIMRGNWGKDAAERDLSGLAAQAKKCGRQIMLSFISDPYCSADINYQSTRKALTILKEYGCSVAVLTKGGGRCLRDMDLFKEWPDKRIKVGATLTFWDSEKSAEWEPGAASPVDRVQTLRVLNQAGIETFVSIEPVIEPKESLACISNSLPFCGSYKVGKWNHDKRGQEIDWKSFGISAVEVLREAGKRIYVKKDLQPYFPSGYLTHDETDMDCLTLPDRKESRSGELLP